MSKGITTILGILCLVAGGLVLYGVFTNTNPLANVSTVFNSTSTNSTNSTGNNGGGGPPDTGGSRGSKGTGFAH